MIRIGLVGEDPNDTSSLKNLLLKKYSRNAKFIPLVNGIRGFQLDNPKIKRALPIEFKSKKCDFIIYIRDLDAFKSDKKKLMVRQKWFNDLDKEINGKGILLLNIWELEALIFANIEKFSHYYKVNYSFKGDPSKIKEPKEKLKEITRNSKNKYFESDCPSLFCLLEIEQLISKCEFFSEFILKLNTSLNYKEIRSNKK